MRRSLALLVLLLLAPGPGATAGESEPRLQELRDAIEARRERVGDYERRQRGLLEALEQIDRTAGLLAREVSRARQQGVEARREVERFEALVAQMEPRFERTRRAMAERAVALYKLGDAGVVRVLFAADDLQDLFGRMELLRRLLASDRDLLARFQRQQQQLEGARQAARQAAARRAEAEVRARQRARELATERGRKRTLLDEVRASRARERAALGELEAAARVLEETLARIQAPTARSAARPQGGAFESRRGRLPRPVGAPIAREFGRRVDEEFRTQVFRKGVDFEAPRGTPVKAVASGTVRLADWFRGYGRVVILDHGDGYFSVSGHLDEIRVEVGDSVAEGRVIGTVGESGSLAGPRLYFELRRGREALDPREWLRGAQAG